MGIVVSLAMLLALFMMYNSETFCQPKHQTYTKIGIGFVVLLGAWNVVWYGVQNIASFWGGTALLSGLCMLLSAQFVYLEVTKSSLIYRSWYSDLKLVTMFVLSLYLLLYIVTIVQLNLGMPIVG